MNQIAALASQAYRLRASRRRPERDRILRRVAEVGTVSQRQLERLLEQQSQQFQGRAA